ncbi:hypothetical protein SAMN06298216_1572 [Spirosomataceae bacterium TFI 002]|nr:hypothetical protein SAMN06298216_1572 [Spirosomataceae bacterium TFI 002]
MKENQEVSVVKKFSNEFLKVPELIFEGLIKSTNDKDQLNIINAYRKPLSEQFKSLSSLINEGFERSTSQAISEAENLITHASGLEMIAAVKPLSLNLKGIFGKLGLASIARELKKLILFVLDLLNVKPWVIDLLLLIDQILNSLLGLDLPTKMPAILSSMEQDYMKELSAHFQLKNQRVFLFNGESEE